VVAIFEESRFFPLYFVVFCVLIIRDDSIMAFEGALQSLRDKPYELLEIILRQADAIEKLTRKVEQLEEQIKELNDRNDGLWAKVQQLETKARQAAPFRIEDQKRAINPKKPARPGGMLVLAASSRTMCAINSW
jgi:hypothetical protein